MRTKRARKAYLAYSSSHYQNFSKHFMQYYVWIAAPQAWQSHSRLAFALIHNDCTQTVEYDIQKCIERIANREKLSMELSWLRMLWASSRNYKSFGSLRMVSTANRWAWSLRTHANTRAQHPLALLYIFHFTTPGQCAHEVEQFFTGHFIAGMTWRVGGMGARAAVHKRSRPKT